MTATGGAGSEMPRPADQLSFSHTVYSGWGSQQSIEAEINDRNGEITVQRVSKNIFQRIFHLEGTRSTVTLSGQDMRAASLALTDIFTNPTDLTLLLNRNDVEVTNDLSTRVNKKLTALRESAQIVKDAAARQLPSPAVPTRFGAPPATPSARPPLPPKPGTIAPLPSAAAALPATPSAKPPLPPKPGTTAPLPSAAAVTTTTTSATQGTQQHPTPIPISPAPDLLPTTPAVNTTSTPPVGIELRSLSLAESLREEFLRLDAMKELVDGLIERQADDPNVLFRFKNEIDQLQNFPEQDPDIIQTWKNQIIELESQLAPYGLPSRPEIVDLSTPSRMEKAQAEFDRLYPLLQAANQTVMSSNRQDMDGIVGPLRRIQNQISQRPNGLTQLEDWVRVSQHALNAINPLIVEPFVQRYTPENVASDSSLRPASGSVAAPASSAASTITPSPSPAAISPVRESSLPAPAQPATPAPQQTASLPPTEANAPVTPASPDVSTLTREELLRRFTGGTVTPIHKRLTNVWNVLETSYNAMRLGSSSIAIPLTINRNISLPTLSGIFRTLHSDRFNLADLTQPQREAYERFKAVFETVTELATEVRQQATARDNHIELMRSQLVTALQTDPRHTTESDNMILEFFDQVTARGDIPDFNTDSSIEEMIEGAHELHDQQNELFETYDRLREIVKGLSDLVRVTPELLERHKHLNELVSENFSPNPEDNSRANSLMIYLNSGTEGNLNDFLATASEIAKRISSSIEIVENYEQALRDATARANSGTHRVEINNIEDFRSDSSNRGADTYYNATILEISGEEGYGLSKYIEDLQRLTSRLQGIARPSSIG